MASTVAQSLAAIAFEKSTTPESSALVMAVSSAMVRYSIASK